MDGGVGRALGISEERCAELVAANWSRWVALAPALGRVPSSGSLESWLRGVPRPLADVVLRGLAELAAESGHDDRDAALVLAWVLHAGADATIARLRDMSPDIDQHVAALLWIEIRTFAWRTKGRVAANILLRVRQRVLVEVGEPGQVWNHRRVLAVTDPVSPERFGCLPTVVEDAPREELERALAWGCRQGVITDEQRRLLLDVVDAARDRPVAVRANSRLFGDVANDLVGLRWGMSGRQVRRLAKASIEALAAAIADAA